MLDLRVQPGGTSPIYRQIVEQISRAVSGGVVPEGELLPSVRALAEQLVINPNTVAKAYSELVREGVVEARHGKGFVVVKRRQVYSRAERTRRLDAGVERLVNEAVLLDVDADAVRDALERALSRMKDVFPQEPRP